MTTRDDGHSSEDRSSFVELLGSPGRVKMLEAFLDHAETTLTANEVAEFADISESTFSRNADLLLDLDLIEVATRVGNTTLYRLNRDSPLAEDFAKAQYHLRKQITDVEADHWSDDDPGQETYDVEAVGDAETRVSTVVPELFAADETERDALATELESIASEHPSAVVDMVPVLIELTDDDNRSVAESVLATLSYVVSEHPDVVDAEDISTLFETVPDALREAHDEPPAATEDRERRRTEASSESTNDSRETTFTRAERESEGIESGDEHASMQ